MATENEFKKQNYSRKLLLHKLKNLVVMLLFLAIVVGGLIAFVAYRKNLQYTNIVTVRSADRISLLTTSYIDNKGTLIAYSKDGMNCINSKGEVLWNITCDLQNPIVRRSDNYVAACDYNGHSIYITDMQGNISSIDTKLPIRDFAICKEGRVAAIIDDSTISWVNLYDVNGTKYSEIKTTMSQTGNPISLDVSDEVLAVSYLYVDGEAVKSRVTFYNFGGVGENVSDKIVSNYGYDNAVVPLVEYLDGENIYAVADDRVLFYNGAKQPKAVIDNLIKEKIIGVYKGYTTVGLVYYDTSGDKKYRIDMYNKSGILEGSYRFDMDFVDIVIRDEHILIYNQSECVLVNRDGREKYHGEFDEPVIFIGTTDRSKEYMFVRENKLELMRFD